MHFDLFLTTLEESNAFLRALWAQMRSHYGTLTWQYTPWRNGSNQTINFGFATMGTSETIALAIRYKQKGVIERLIVESADPKQDGLPEGIRECVDGALRIFRSPSQFNMSSILNVDHGFTLHPYISNRFGIVPEGPESVSLSVVVDAFDKLDAEFQFLITAQKILDFLTSCTNCVIRLARISEKLAAKAPGDSNKIWKSAGWIDDYPLVDKRLALAPEHIVWIEELLDGTVPSNTQLVRATRLFREALQVQRSDPDTSGELITAVLMSALEVASLDEGENYVCATCGQNVYRISRRISELGLRHLGKAGEWIFRRDYAVRSQFLHAGMLVNQMPLMSSSQPLLDPSAPQGCALPSAVSCPRNLLEFTSYVLRAECHSWHSGFLAARKVYEYSGEVEK